MSGRGRGVTVNRGESSTKLERLTVPASLAAAARRAAKDAGVTLAQWRRDAYAEKLAQDREKST